MGKFQGKTAAEWRNSSAASRQRSADSYERSDTDGFMSQWAADTMAQKYALCAELAENDGKAEFRVPFDLEKGEVIKGKWVQGKYGNAWVTEEGVFLNPSSASNIDTRVINDAKKGFKMVIVEAEATVHSGGSQTTVNYWAVPIVESNWKVLRDDDVKW